MSAQDSLGVRVALILPVVPTTAGSGKCELGAGEEPSCITDEPLAGWPSLREKDANQPPPVPRRDEMSVDVRHGDCLLVLAEMPAESVQCVVTSPPYWGLRDYGVPGQLGLEATPEEYVERMVAVFREVRRVLRKDGTLWLNLGDSYAAEWRDTGAQRHSAETHGSSGRQHIGGRRNVASAA